MNGENRGRSTAVPRRRRPDRRGPDGADPEGFTGRVTVDAGVLATAARDEPPDPPVPADDRGEQPRALEGGGTARPARHDRGPHLPGDDEPDSLEARLAGGREPAGNTAIDT